MEKNILQFDCSLLIFLPSQSMFSFSSLSFFSFSSFFSLSFFFLSFFLFLSFDLLIFLSFCFQKSLKMKKSGFMSNRKIFFLFSILKFSFSPFSFFLSFLSFLPLSFSLFQEKTTLKAEFRLEKIKSSMEDQDSLHVIAGLLLFLFSFLFFLLFLPNLLYLLSFIFPPPLFSLSLSLLISL